MRLNSCFFHQLIICFLIGDAIAITFHFSKRPTLKANNLDSLVISNANFLCYIADKESYDIIYVNPPLKKILEPAYGSDFNYIGKKCYKIFQNLDKPCPHCENENLKPEQFIHRQMFVELTQKNYILVDSLIELEEKFQRLTIAYDYSTEHPTAKNTQDEMFLLKNSKEFLALLDATPICMNLLNMSTQARICNQKVLDIFKLPNRQAYSEQFYELSPKYQPDGRTSEEAANDYIQQAREKGYIKFMWLHCDLEGNEIPTELELKRLDLLDEEGQPYFACYFKDLRSEFAGVEEEITDGYFYDTISTKTLFKTVADMIEGWYFSYDLRSLNIQFYGKGKEILSLPSEKRLYPEGFNIEALVHKDDLDLFYKHLELIKQGHEEAWEVRFLLPTGEYRYFRTIYKIINDHEQKPIFCLGRTYDVHEKKMLEVLSQTDLLTNCLNKITTENLVKNIIDKNKNASHAMFIFDIDNFKIINDTLGHQIGDIALIEIAKHLHTYFRDGDIIGRIGGDEFIVFLKNIDDIEIIISKAEIISAAFRKTYLGEDFSHKLSGSIGIALYPNDGTSYEELYSAADKALYQSKIKGKNCFTFYSENNIQKLTATNTLENADRIVNTYIDSDVVNTVFDIMYKAQNISHTMEEILKFISEKFSVHRAYIFEITEDRNTYKHTYEYCKEGHSPSDEALSEITRESFSDFFDLLSQRGIIFYNDYELKEIDLIYQSLQKQKVKSFLLLQVKGEKYPEIVLGLDDCEKHRVWNEKHINSLRYLVKLLTIFLLFSKKNI